MAKKSRFSTKNGEDGPKDPMAYAGSVEDEIMKRHNVGGIAANHAYRDVIIIDTGILSLNLALGTNGLLGGRMSLLWGERASAKTFIMMCIIAQVQRDGGRAAFIDAEGTFDGLFAKIAGVNVDELFLVSGQEKRFAKNQKGEKTDKKLPPLSGEEMYDIINLLIHSGNYNLVGTDSITAMVPHEILMKPTLTMDKQKGPDARMHSIQLKKTNAFLIINPQCHYMMISQSRDRPDIMGGGGGGAGATGGKGKDFYISYEMYTQIKEKIREVQPIADGCTLKVEQDVGMELKVGLRKLKVARIKNPAEFYVDLRTGVCQATDVFRTAKMLGVIEISGTSWYKYHGTSWNGEGATILAMKENPEIYEDIRKDCLNELGMKFTNLKEDGENVAAFGTEEFKEQLEEFKQGVGAEINKEVANDEN